MRESRRPPPGPSRLDRRRRRSSDPLVALSRLLEAVRHRKRLQTVALADASGCLIAGAGAFTACEELAARAPFVTRNTEPANDTVPCRVDLLTARAQLVRFRLDGVEVLLCADGGSQPADLGDAVDAARRILVPKNY